MNIPSVELIYEGSAKEFISSLTVEAMDHPATNHVYLKRIADGEFRDTTAILRDYAFNYSFYSREFVSYVEGVIGGLTNMNHREKILENLEEEKGDPKATDPKLLPHVELFNIFRRAVGINDEYYKKNKPCNSVLIWRDLFLQKCQSRQEGVGLSAMGIGTELIVPKVYKYFLEGMRKHTNLKPEDYLFFELHAECDEHHAQSIVDILEEMAEDVEKREAIRFGALSALNLRKNFWDVLLARAMRI